MRKNVRKNLYRTVSVILIAAVMSLMLAGCGGSKFSTTSVGNKIKIEVKDAADGDQGEGPVISVGKNKTVSVASELESGQLQIEFVEAINMRTDIDDPDDYVYGDVILTVTVGAGDSVEEAIPYGDYLMQFTAVGDTTGTVAVNIN